MNFEQAKIDVLNWVVNFVEKPNSNLDGWPPCPYARRARLDNEFEILPGCTNPYDDLKTASMGDKTVKAFVYDPKLIEADDFNQQILDANQHYLLEKNIIALADHPNCREEIKGVVMNQGTWAIAFIQPLDKLNHFARLIAGKGYYDGWPEEYLQDLFEGREDPRS